MGTEAIVMAATRLSLGAVATFLSIVLWSMTRDTAWMLIIMGTILKYGEIIYSTFGIFGLVPGDVMVVPGILSVETVLVNLPLVFYLAAFLVMIRRNRMD